VTTALQGAVPLPHVDGEAGADDATPRQGEWFRFRRHLRFGVGAADDDHAVRALVLVDETPVDEDGAVPGLLLTGAPHHLQEPYAYDAPDGVAGARSGSGTGQLFKWLRAARDTLDEDARAGLDGPAADLFGSNPVRSSAATATSMYRLFARDDWLEPPFPDISRPAFCEGVAIASLIMADSDLTVIMGSPLYVRVASAVEPDDSRHRARSWVRRLLGEPDA
jgi:hypothetical protein